MYLILIIYLNIACICQNKQIVTKENRLAKQIKLFIITIITFH